MSPVCPLQRYLNTLSFRCSLADFQIEKKIGRGQFSEVYKATCLLDRKTVALKKVQVSQRPHGVKRLITEASFRVSVLCPWAGPSVPFPAFLHKEGISTQLTGLRRESGGLLFIKAYCEP